MADTSTTQAPTGAGVSKNNNMPAASGTASGQNQPITDSLGQSLSPGGMRGIGLVVFMIAQIALKLDTLKLAQDYFNTNKKDFDFFKATYQPGEAKSALEVMSPITNPYYVTDLYASAPAGLSTSKTIDKQWFETRRRTARNSVGAMRRIDYEFALMRAAAVASGWNMGRRYEMAWADAHNERAYNRKLSMANVGIAAGNTMREGLATAVGKVEGAYQGLENSLASVGNGYYAKQGMEDARKDIRARTESVTTMQQTATVNPKVSGPIM